MSIHEVPRLIGDLYKISLRLEEIFEGRRFTPDGHLVGSIGEVVAEYVYGLKLAAASTAQFDAETMDGRTVQIKLTGRGGKSFGFRWFSAQIGPYPDLLIGMKLTDRGFHEIFNGPFPVSLLEGRKDSKNGQLSISTSRLESLNPRLLPQFNSLEAFNELFTREVASE